LHIQLTVTVHPYLSGPRLSGPSILWISFLISSHLYHKWQVRVDSVKRPTSTCSFENTN